MTTLFALDKLVTNFGDVRERVHARDAEDGSTTAHPTPHFSEAPSAEGFQEYDLPTRCVTPRHSKPSRRGSSAKAHLPLGSVRGNQKKTFGITPQNRNQIILSYLIQAINVSFSNPPNKSIFLPTSDQLHLDSLPFAIRSLRDGKHLMDLPRAIRRLPKPERNSLMKQKNWTVLTPLGQVRVADT